MAIVAPHRGETNHPADILHSPQLGPASRWCRFAPIKKPVYLPMLPSNNSLKPNPFPENQPAPGVHLRFKNLVFEGI
jgi:hypothetical protein